MPAVDFARKLFTSAAPPSWPSAGMTAGPPRPSGPATRCQDPATAFGYVRSASADGSAESLGRQRNSIARYLLRIPARLAAPVFSDAGASGISSERPGLIRLMRHLESWPEGRRPGILVVEDLDRLARDRVLLWRLVRQVMSCGFEVHTVADGPVDPDRVLPWCLTGPDRERERSRLTVSFGRPARRGASRRRKPVPPPSAVAVVAGAKPRPMASPELERTVGDFMRILAAARSVRDRRRRRDTVFERLPGVRARRRLQAARSGRRAFHMFLAEPNKGYRP